MNARELLKELEEMNPLTFDDDERERYKITHRAMSLLAAAEANDWTTPETDENCIQGMFIDAAFSRLFERERNGLAARVAELEPDAARIAFLGEQNRWNGGTGYSIFTLDSGDVYVRPMKPENAAAVGVTVHPDIRSAIDAARSKP